MTKVEYIEGLKKFMAEKKLMEEKELTHEVVWAMIDYGYKVVKEMEEQSGIKLKTNESK